MKESQPSSDSGQPSLPPALEAELERMDGPPIHVPASLDAAILSSAKAEFTQRTRWRPVIWWASAAATIAATVAIVFVVRMALVHPPRHLAKGDLNGNGKVDMLDAYILAKRLAGGAKIDRAWDVNGDGVVDQQDVDWIANTAVSVGPAGGAGGGASQ